MKHIDIVVALIAAEISQGTCAANLPMSDEYVRSVFINANTIVRIDESMVKRTYDAKSGIVFESREFQEEMKI